MTPTQCLPPKLHESSRPALACLLAPTQPHRRHSANSQFFICFDEARFLDKNYTVWGKVIEGMDNVDKIKRGEPVKDPDKMISIRVAADVK